MTTVTRRGASKWVRKSSQWRCGWMGLAEKRVRDLHKGGKTWAAQRQKWPGLVETGVQSKRPHEQVYGMQWGTWLDRQNYRSLGWMLSIWEGLLTLCVCVCGCICIMWKFPGEGSNQNCSCGLHHSHSNTGSKLHLSTPQLAAKPDA